MLAGMVWRVTPVTTSAEGSTIFCHDGASSGGGSFGLPQRLDTRGLHASRMGWELPIFPSKQDVDASYKRMLLAATEPEAAAAVRLGIASHNVFDLAFGLVLRASRGVEQEVGFEVLEGMANSVQKALSLVGAPVLILLARRRKVSEL